jgi:hypothetical protein
MKLQSPRTTLFVILARDAAVAAILRRGPSKSVQLIRWDTARDAFEEGQWFKGRVYERRCDLSPDGLRLVYFAGKHRPPHSAWTAVSNVPYFTALAMWPKGDTYGGGGLFETGTLVSLNHRAGDIELAEGFEAPRKLQVRRLEKDGGFGGDNPVYDMRLRRDGWRPVEDGEVADEYRKPSQIKRRSAERQYELAMQMKAVDEPNGPWNVVEYVLRNHKREVVADLGRLDWADWDPRRRDLLFARAGRLFRAVPEFKPKKPWDASNAVEIADFSENRFVPVPPPPAALRW